MGASSSNVPQWKGSGPRSGPRVNPVATAAWPRLLALLAALEDRATPCAEDPAPWADVESPQGVKAAEAACRDCPVMRECGAYGDALHVRVGVWGGRYRGPRVTAQREPHCLRQPHSTTGTSTTTTTTTTTEKTKRTA